MLGSDSLTAAAQFELVAGKAVFGLITAREQLNFTVTRLL
jgi:hypothetical protein